MSEQAFPRALVAAVVSRHEECNQYVRESIVTTVQLESNGLEMTIKHGADWLRALAPNTRVKIIFEAPVPITFDDETGEAVDFDYDVPF